MTLAPSFRELLQVQSPMLGGSSVVQDLEAAWLWLWNYSSRHEKKEHMKSK